MGEREETGGYVGGLRLVGDPVVDRAEEFSAEQSDTAELPTPAEIRAELPTGGVDRLIARPGSGVRGWAGRIRAVLADRAQSLIFVAAVSAGPMHLFAGRVADTLVAASVLSDLARGVGLLLLPLMWLSYLGLAALPMVLSLTGVVAVVVGWAAGAGFRTVLGTTVHRVGLLWAWLAGLDAVVHVRWLIPEDITGPQVGLLLSICAAVLSAVLAVLIGVLGCVVLFERGRGARRALYLLSIAPRGVLGGLGVAGLGLTVLPTLADALAGPLAAALVAVAGSLVWAVAALITYAQARRLEGPLTSAHLRFELSV